MKDINVEDRLIFALDLPEIDQAKDIVTELDDSVNFYKIGMEMLMTGDYFCLLYTSPSPRDQRGSRMPSSA